MLAQTPVSGDAQLFSGCIIIAIVAIQIWLIVLLFQVLSRAKGYMVRQEQTSQAILAELQRIQTILSVTNRNTN